MPAHTLLVEDSPEHAQHVHQLLAIPRERARQYGQSAQRIIDEGQYTTNGGVVVLSGQMAAARARKQSIPPDMPLEVPASPGHALSVRIANETTLMAARRYAEDGRRAMVLNFANGVSVGGGYLRGSRAQEETLCFASTLPDTLCDDPFYTYNSRIPRAASSAYAILSTAHVFRNDHYEAIPEPWEMDVLTCAAPVCERYGGLGRDDCKTLMHARIRRVYTIAAANHYDTLVLGAWGCGAFNNDIPQTARSFASILLEDFASFFDAVTFAISDWSPERRFITPFVDAFRPTARP